MRRPMLVPRARPRSTAAAVAACALVAAMAGPVLALDQPPVLRDPVTDMVDALTPAEEQAVTAELARVRDQDGVQLFVALIDTTGSETAPAFTQATAEASSMGGNDALLLVAFDDRSDALWVGPSLGGVTDAEIDAILTDHLEPSLAAGDTEQALIAATDALGRAATGDLEGTDATEPPGATDEPVPTSEPVPTAVPGAPGAGSGSFVKASDFVPALVVLAILAAIVVAFLLRQRRRQSAAQEAALAQLDRDASQALLHSDEALKDAANDVKFAAEQWGVEEVVPYRDAIVAANEELRAAFSIRQGLDDADPELPEQREQLLREILAHTTKATTLLDEQEHRFDQLRDLQAAAPAQLEAMPATIAQLRARRDAADATLTRLRSAYAASAVAPVAGNLEEAAKALEAAANEAERGGAVVASKPPEGVTALRRAQEAVARATQLVDAVERLAASLDDAATRLPGELDAASRDVAAAREAVARLANEARGPAAAAPALAAPGAPAPVAPVAPPPAAPGGPAPAAPVAPAPVAPTAPAPAPATPGPTAMRDAAASPPAAPADPAGALRDAEASLAAAQQAASATPPDPLSALQHAVAANHAADAIVAQVRDAESRAATRLRLAQSAVASAEARVSRANDFIVTRRHGVGETARTRIAEAQTRLDEARSLVDSDPERASATANRAASLADQAYQLASGEFDTWNQGSWPVAGPYQRGGAGSDVAGAIIGGIIGGMLAGGGRGSGWGGSPWGGPFGTPGRRGSGGGFGLPPGPFGGGGFGGGGFGGGFGGGGGGGDGGGGRVRGGRW